MQKDSPIESTTDAVVPLAVIDATQDMGPSWMRLLPEPVRSRIAGRHNLRAVAGNSIWLFLDKILRMGVALVLGVWIARYLGPDKYGLLNYAIAFASLFGAVATLGLDGIVIRDLVNHREKSDVILGSAFVLKLGGALLASSMTIISIAIVRRGDTLALWIVSLTAASFLFQSLNVIDFVFQSKVQSQYTVYSSNGAFLLMALVKVYLLLHGGTIMAFTWATLGEAILTALFLVVAYGAKKMDMSKWRARTTVMKEMLHSSWPLMLSGVSILIATRIDQVLIGQMLNDKQVGIYSVAAKVAEMWYFIPMGIVSSTFPLLIESKKVGEEIFFQRLQKLFTTLVMLGIGVSLAMTFLSGPIMHLLYGPKYQGSERVLNILIWSGIPVAYGCVWSNWMLLENKTHVMFLFQVNAAIWNILLNLLLIPHFGIIGSAYATLISYSIGHTLLAALIKSQHKALGMLGKAIFPF